MNDYDNDYTDDMYDRYMLTGEGAEYFEDFEDITEEDDYVEEVNINQTHTEIIETDIAETEAPEYVDINKQLDEIIRILKRQLKEKERLLKHQNRKTTQKKKQLRITDLSKRKNHQPKIGSDVKLTSAQWRLSTRYVREVGLEVEGEAFHAEGVSYSLEYDLAFYDVDTACQARIFATSLFPALVGKAKCVWECCVGECEC